MTVQLRPFRSDDLAAAAGLLAQRHAEHRRHQPLLAQRFGSAEHALTEIAALWEAGASGSVALQGDEVVGYLLGAPKGSEVWGPNTWVEAAGHAVREPELVRDLYAHAAAGWVEDGRTAHYALVPASDTAVIEAWFHLCFGLQHVHAIKEMPAPPHLSSTQNAQVRIRSARRDDIAVLAALDLTLPQHQAASPVFSGETVPSLEEARTGWEEDFDDPDFAVFVAEISGQVVGCSIGCSLEKSRTHVGLARPDDAGFLGFAAVLPEHRGLGAGRALGAAVLDWAALSGYRSVVTDWRATNLLSSRAWPALGFTPIFVRLHRIVGR